jgi:dTDP-4-dehydrorhamnose reductase
MNNNSSPILIFGANGQVGSALAKLLGNKAVALSRAEADFSHPELLEAIIAAYNPAAVINACAYTQVDKAEEEEALAYTVNASAPELLARACASRNIPFIHYSTDYVFPGNGERAWIETDITSPLNAYGRTKRAGEEKIEACGGKYLIFRTSWVYDESGKNFLNTMLRLGSERETLTIVGDQRGAPTYAPALAKATLQALRNAQNLPEFPSGIYHLCGAGVTSWHEFAEAIFQQARKKKVPLKIQEVKAIATAAYPTPAKRPLNSQLNCSKARQILTVELPAWQESLQECMEQKYESYTV